MLAVLYYDKRTFVLQNPKSAYMVPKQYRDKIDALSPSQLKAISFIIEIASEESNLLKANESQNQILHTFRRIFKRLSNKLTLRG